MRRLGRVGLQAGERGLGLLAAAGADVGLDQVGAQLDDGRAEAAAHQLAFGGLQGFDRLGVAAEGELELAERGVEVDVVGELEAAG